ncbi:MAG: J domain-containing protein [Deltaproteobacteria bacterium]|nr:J domain-containing protein [Deltaproteobacteria bacterium]
MNIERCFHILELDQRASLKEARQAYKDIVDVWHPDRFSHNPRLKEKAEKKLKEINTAYEVVESFLSSKRQNQRKERAESRTGDRTEAAVEAGTRLVLTACSFLYTRLRRWVDNQATESEAEETSKPAKKAYPDKPLK